MNQNAIFNACEDYNDKREYFLQKSLCTPTIAGFKHWNYFVMSANYGKFQQK